MSETRTEDQDQSLSLKDPPGVSVDHYPTELPPARMIPWPGLNPRRDFDISGLKETIRSGGVIQPLVVRYPVPEDERVSGEVAWIVAGERRWMAAKEIDPEAPVPVLCGDHTRSSALEISLIENLEREDLNPVEEAEGIQTLKQKTGMTQREVAKRLGRSPGWASQRLGLLVLPDSLLDLVRKGDLASSVAYDLLVPWHQLTDAENRNEIWKDVATQLLEKEKPTAKKVRAAVGQAINPHSKRLSLLDSSSRLNLEDGRCPGCDCGTPVEGRCFNVARLNRLLEEVGPGHPKYHPVPYTDLDRKSKWILSQWEKYIDHPPSERIWPYHDSGEPYPICHYIVHELDPEHLWAFVQPAEKRKNVVWEIHYVGDEESLKRARRRFRNEVSSTARDVREVALETEVGAEATLNWSDAVAQVIPWAARTDVDTVGAAIYKLARDLGFASREEVSQGNQLTYRHALPRVLDRLDSRQAENLYAVLALRLERDQVPDNAGTGAFEDLVTTAVGIRERRALQGMIPEEWGWSLDRCDPR